ncbi:bifunctional DNA-formamidopyrimidine glycosylase/DNA-(apurinic or apyrimidinic site) lyase [Nguyenibacter sp. L1]|uniref:bifunctional DNA-formamidopyrimidine glycosylase/DNA-(apurinic or apyrimidinic site) lyase n=1 Tax=Nguyenibacter sp. L1 TaxID=3049350 RepID=UPI002B474D50|nr:bifunctional DNA-formamidopyrimidine glycosylase/DNA-(apurinic or apyrimidinic site) lyase [Nguyenibacter sp. L1]WRH88079.1 bifunctional DNA-formamidopyrimidine glycosylase/DNA-(apurinic or apyrimidinic site) lyase [Nguyenibacter sp. L1]
MPELPEVETVMRGMRSHLDGRRIAQVAVRRADLRFPFPADLAARLRGARIVELARRAKYILLRLDSGQTMLLHLGMSGRVLLTPPGAANGFQDRHEHLAVTMEDGTHFGLVDPRRFGAVDLMPTSAETTHRLLAHLGPEPLGNDFSQHWLHQAIGRRRTTIKAALLDQGVVAGLGNIYVSEALYRAAIHPARLACSLTAREEAALVRGIRAVLRDAIAAGGSSLRDYVQTDGTLGYFQHEWRVYGRAGTGCPDCPGAPVCGGVVRLEQAGRSSYFCPMRQRPPDGSGRAAHAHEDVS